MQHYRIRLLSRVLGEEAKICPSSHARQSVRRDGPALCPGRGRLVDVPLDRLPSLPSLRKLGFRVTTVKPSASALVREVLGYYGAVRLLSLRNIPSALILLGFRLLPQTLSGRHFNFFGHNEHSIQLWEVNLISVSTLLLFAVDL